MSDAGPVGERDQLNSLSPLSSFFAALQFLTIAPALIRRPFTAREMGRSVGYYPLVGILLGVILLGANYLLTYILPLQVRIVLILVLWVTLTGALHLDGFLDAFDGLFGGSSPEDRMRIMRDERIGAFALAGGVLLFMTKFSTLAVLPDMSMALLLAPTLGRWGMSLAIVAFPYAREQGLGRDIKEHATWRQAVISTVITLVIVWIAGQQIGLISFIVAAIALWIGASFTMRRIPGLTGDIYGGINEIIEVVVLLTLIVGQSLT